MNQLMSFFSQRKNFLKAYQVTSLNGDLSPTALDQLQLFVGDTIAVKDTTVFMWYTANGQSDGSNDTDQIFLATKDLKDGLPITDNWIKYDNGTGEAVPVIVPVTDTWRDEQVFAKTVFYDTDSNEWKMYITGDDRRTATTKFTVGLFTSQDGISWTPNAGNPIYENFTDFTENGVTTFSVYKESINSYHALAYGFGRLGDDFGAIYLTSTDGVTWAKQQDTIMLGTDIRHFVAIRKSGTTFYVYASAGRNTNFAPSLGGISNTIRLYTTDDLSNQTYDLVGDIYNAIEPQEAGCGSLGLFSYHSKYYMVRNYTKNQVKNAFSGGEPFSAIKIIESSKDFKTIITPDIIFPSYLKRYYPCYQADESQTPAERITGELPITTGTLSWTQLRYIDFTGTQLLTYPEYVPAGTTKFAVKGRVLPQATLTRQIIRQSNGANGWAMFLNAGKLQVDLYENTTLKKSYITISDVVKPTGVHDENDHASVGFIFDSGNLKLCFGSSADQSTTKTVDLTLNNIETGSNDVEIGAGSVTNEMRSFCIFDEITEDQWLNVIDL